MSKRKFFIVLFALQLGFMSAEAQLLIKQDGRVYVGPTAQTDDDLGGVLSMSIQGRKSGHAGSKLGFGDFGLYNYDGWNVFVGEYDTIDSDMLWPHGKNGFKLTRSNGGVVVMEWPSNNYLIPSMTIYDNTRVDRLVISSDDAHKQNVLRFGGALGMLNRLHGIKYLYKPVNEITLPVADRNRALSEKETSDRDRMEQAKAIHDQGRLRYGFVASDVATIFPELVEEDAEGNQYINYIEMIPVLVNALNEMAEYVGLTREDTTTEFSEERIIANAKNREETFADSAILYQNTPNPFSDNTIIKYHISTEVVNAAIYVFNLVGTMLQTHPITDFGNGHVTISGSSLEAGMYVYALVVDGQIIDSKRMILTK